MFAVFWLCCEICSSCSIFDPFFNRNYQIQCLCKLYSNAVHMYAYTYYSNSACETSPYVYMQYIYAYACYLCIVGTYAYICLRLKYLYAQELLSTQICIGLGITQNPKNLNQDMKCMGSKFIDIFEYAIDCLKTQSPLYTNNCWFNIQYKGNAPVTAVSLV